MSKKEDKNNPYTCSVLFLQAYLHGLHGTLDELHPGVAFFLGAGQDLHHLRLLNARRDEEEAALLVGYLPNDQLLEGDDCGALVLRGEWREGRRD